MVRRLYGGRAALVRRQRCPEPVERWTVEGQGIDPPGKAFTQKDEAEAYRDGLASLRLHGWKATYRDQKFWLWAKDGSRYPIFLDVIERRWYRWIDDGATTRAEPLIV